MRKRCLTSAVVLAAVLMYSTSSRAQSSQGGQSGAAKDGSVDGSSPLHIDGWGRIETESPKAQPGPAPRHDMSGIWEPANGWRDGVQAFGAKANPSDGKHTLPMTPLGEKMFNANKPTQGFTSVGARDTNDPANLYCSNT